LALAWAKGVFTKQQRLSQRSIAECSAATLPKRLQHIPIDLARLKVKAKRVNITMPENLLHEIDRYADKYHMTRSGLLAQAAGEYIHRKSA
jgi:hypothetical protein